MKESEMQVLPSVLPQGTGTEQGGAGGYVPRFTEVQRDIEINDFLKLSDEHLGAVGFTEHGLRHANRVASFAAKVLIELGHGDEEVDLARIAGYCHDIGNFICRTNHGQTGATLLYPVLKRYNFTDRQLGVILSAVGNHEEQYGQVFNAVCAAVVIADKSDVHRTRVRHWDPHTRDVHDQVNYAVTSCKLELVADLREIILQLRIDVGIASVMDYFEIFLSRMEMCRNAARFLGCEFKLTINETLLS
jgi:metal-dependent HD superfamily phosphatase/phosphodiesterase